MGTIVYRQIEPAIHYWGTPVVLVASLNPDGKLNVSPMSSAWWLGWSCMLGFDASSQTVANLRRERECVLHLASGEDAGIVNALALTTGSSAVPLHKKMLGYRHEPDKPARANLTLLPSVEVRTPRIAECRVHLEAVVAAIRPFAARDPRMAIPACSVEVRIVAVHADEALLSAADRIDAGKWEPLLMSFRELFVRGPRAGASKLARGDEARYAPWKRGPAMRLAARAIGALAQRKYGVIDERPATDPAAEAEA